MYMIIGGNIIHGFIRFSNKGGVMTVYSVKKSRGAASVENVIWT